MAWCEDGVNGVYRILYLVGYVVWEANRARESLTKDDAARTVMRLWEDCYCVCVEDDEIENW